MAFTLVEILVAMSLLTLIVLALMAVFSSTQRAFRAGLTQTDVLESGRAAVDMIAADLAKMTPSLLDKTNSNFTPNFFASIPAYTPLIQSLPASLSGNAAHTYVLQDIFFLSKANQTWTGIGYFVRTNNNGSPLMIGLPFIGLGTLYRFSEQQSAAQFAQNPQLMVNDFAAAAVTFNSTNTSQVLDGALGFKIRTYNPNGSWIVSSNLNNSIVVLTNSSLGEVSCWFYSNAVPASIEFEMATLEDRAQQRVAALNGSFQAQTNYLAQHAGQVHIFRQRVPIRTVDPSAYQ